MENTYYEIKNPHTEDVSFTYLGKKYFVQSNESVKNIDSEVAMAWKDVHQFLKLIKMSKPTLGVKEVVEDTKEITEEVKEEVLEDIEEVVEDTKEITNKTSTKK